MSTRSFTGLKEELALLSNRYAAAPAVACQENKTSAGATEAPEVGALSDGAAGRTVKTSGVAVVPCCQGPGRASASRRRNRQA